MNKLIKDFGEGVDEILVEVMDEVSWLRTRCAAIGCEDNEQKQQDGHL